MKIGIVGLPMFGAGKTALKDLRVDTLEKMFSAAKKTYLALDIVTDEAKLSEADAIICAGEKRLDLIVHDMEFIEGRLSKAPQPEEQALLARFKEQLEKETFISQGGLSDAEKAVIAGFGLLTARPIVVAGPGEAEDAQKLLTRAYQSAGGISFLTAGEKEARAWSIRQGDTAWVAAGCIHSDIQRGFIRAEVVSYDELVAAGGMNQVKSKNLLRLENKEYVVKDGDCLMFRFNK